MDRPQPPETDAEHALPWRGETLTLSPKYLDLVVFVSALGFGLVAFSQISYPLVTLIPKVQKILKENRHERSVLVSLLLIAPAIWLIVLASTIVLVCRYLPNHSKTYFLGLVIVLFLVLFNLYKRNREMEDDFLFRLKGCIRLSKEDSLVRKYPRYKLKG